MTSPEIAIGQRLNSDVLQPLKETFVGKDEIVDLMGIALVAGENLFLLGPPGTAKSALVIELGRLLQGTTFTYLLTRFTEPNELFGPFDIRRLREGELISNTEGMLPEASLVFLDELLNANSAILNSLLTVLNERVFRRGKEVRTLPMILTIGASNQLPEDEALRALFDRFMLRVHCDAVDDTRLGEVMRAGWQLEQRTPKATPPVSTEEVRVLNAALTKVDVTPVRDAMVDLVQRLRHAGIDISDRRAVKMQRLVAASAMLCGREAADRSDLWVFRYIWDRLEQEEVLRAMVDAALADAPESESPHPRSVLPEAPDPELLQKDLEELDARLNHDLTGEEKDGLRDHLRAVANRVQWVEKEVSRDFLTSKIEALWERFGTKS